MPERTEEQGETVRLKEAGEVTEEGCTADHLLSESSERMDSRDEARRSEMSAEFVGLALSSDTDTLFVKKPELTSERPVVSWHGRGEMSLRLLTAVSIEAVFWEGTWLGVFPE